MPDTHSHTWQADIALAKIDCHNQHLWLRCDVKYCAMFAGHSEIACKQPVTDDDKAEDTENRMHAYCLCAHLQQR